MKRRLPSCENHRIIRTMRQKCCYNELSNCGMVILGAVVGVIQWTSSLMLSSPIKMKRIPWTCSKTRNIKTPILVNLKKIGIHFRILYICAFVVLTNNPPTNKYNYMSLLNMLPTMHENRRYGQVSAAPYSSSSYRNYNQTNVNPAISTSTTVGATTTTTSSTTTTPNTLKSPRSSDVLHVEAMIPEYGTLRGKREHGIDFFGRIPYASPPVGMLRWAPPDIPPTPWYPSTLDATQYGRDCWQLIDPVINPTITSPDQMSEDCLYLNIYAPAGSNRQSKKKWLLPVMVWLHGGAFQQGGANRPEYDGKRLAERGTIVVTINYRLGALGFLVSSTDGIYGNFGLMDQRAALHWIRSHIHNFGGDPDNITLFGESAGAVMTGLHLLMENNKSNNNDNDNNNHPGSTSSTKKKTGKRKRKKKLFHKAIIQSNPLGLQFRSVVVADFIGEALKRSVDCRDLGCLRAERVEEIMRAQSSLMGIPRSVGDFFTWGPTLTDELRITIGATTTSSSTSSSSSSTSNPYDDGKSTTKQLLPQNPLSNMGSNPRSTTNPYQQPFGKPDKFTYRDNAMFRDLDSWKWQVNRDNALTSVNVTQPLKNFELIPDDIPVIIGVNKNEGEMFVHGAFPITMSKAVYWMFVGALFRDNASRVLKHYRGYVDQIEKDAEILAKKQIHEEECKQFYLDNQMELDREYQYLLQLNESQANQSDQNNNDDNYHHYDKTDGRTSSRHAGYEALVRTWSRGGGSKMNKKNSKHFNTAITELYDSSNNDRNQQCPWYEKVLFPFQKRDDEWYRKRTENRRLHEERKVLRRKDRALKDAAKVVVDYRPVMSRIIDDYLFRCPAWNLAHKLSRKRNERDHTNKQNNKDKNGINKNNNVFVYQFSHSTHIPGYKECWGKACHTAELPFVFQAMDIIRTNYSTLGPYAQQEAPESPQYPYTDLLAAYHDAMEAADRAESYESAMGGSIDDDSTNNNLYTPNSFFYDNLGQQNQQQHSSQNNNMNNNSTGSSSSSGQINSGFQSLLNHFFGDYFKEDADEEIASDMADRWVSFARTGDPNYVGSKAEWRPWRKVFDDDDDDHDNNNNNDNNHDYDSSGSNKKVPQETYYNDNNNNYQNYQQQNIANQNDDRQRMWQPEDFDELFDRNGISDFTVVAASSGNVNNTNVEGDYWFDNNEDRFYRRRALIALGMEVVEEDVFKTLLRRTKYKEETDNPFHNLLNRLSGTTPPSSSANYKKGGKEKHMRRAIRQLQQMSQEMGFIGTGVQGEPRRGNMVDYWEDSFFPEIMELKWPPEGRLIERDCTCDMWDKIRYRY